MHTVNKARVGVDTTLADSEAIDIQNVTSGRIVVPTGSSITALAFYEGPSQGGVFLPMYDSSNAAISLTVSAGRSYQFPLTALAGQWLKLVATGGDGVVDLKFNKAWEEKRKP